MRWPWKRQASDEQLVVSWSAQVLAFVLARRNADGTHQLLKWGVERQGQGSMEHFVQRLQALGLKGRLAHIMLRPEQCQFLQIDVPAVAPEELRAAARYQIKDMLQVPVDDVTLDVLRVGDEAQKSKGQLFVVAATTAAVRSVLDLGEALQWKVSVIDVQETAQRNLQSALAVRDRVNDRANAALVLIPGQQAVLTIGCNDELFYTRRFALAEGFFASSWVFDGDDDKAQQLLVEVQRSLDVWDRTWFNMPLAVVRVYAGERGHKLAEWLGPQIGLKVAPMDLNVMFPGFESATLLGLSPCLPLLGVLLRTEHRKF